MMRALVPWSPDLEDGQYRNPVIYADYPDPDVIRVGPDYYMTTSSFCACPGLPILQSRDLVHWVLLGHALPRLDWADFSKPRHGGGVYAPSLRFHDGWFWIFFPDPDHGLFMIRARDPRGPWSRPVCMIMSRGWIDPCPFWDEDGTAWLVHAFAKSRCGLHSVLFLSRMNCDGTALIDERGNPVGEWTMRLRYADARGIEDEQGRVLPGHVVYDGRADDPYVEGPKLYKRQGWYYLFAPAGSVKQGWQLVLRSRNIAGPYERRIVLSQGTSSINGPHQGAWVDGVDGEHWFVHFQDRGVYGRVVHLNPLRWRDDGWCEIGNAASEPVESHPKPRIASPPSQHAFASLPGGDVASQVFSPEWQWPATPATPSAEAWVRLSDSGMLELAACDATAAGKNLFAAPNVLLQKFPAPEFSVSVTVSLPRKHEDQCGGLVVYGLASAWISFEYNNIDVFIVLRESKNRYGGVDAMEYGPVEERFRQVVDSQTIRLRLSVVLKDGVVMVLFAFGLPGETWRSTGIQFMASPSVWMGAKFGIFAGSSAGAGWVGFSPVEISSVEPSSQGNGKGA